MAVFGKGVMETPWGPVISSSTLPDGSTGYWSKILTTSAMNSGSVWVRRAKLGAVQPIFDNKVYFNASDQLVAWGLTSTALFRDPTAWIHIFWNASGVWVNGVAVTGSGTYATAAATNPRWGYDGTNFANMYFTAFAFWDGSSESITGGAFDEGGAWQYATAASPNYTIADWTENGTITQVSESPTDNRAGTVGCFTTFNPLHEDRAGTLSNGNLTVSGGSEHQVSTLAMDSGQWGWKVTVRTTESQSHGVEQANGAQTESLYTASFTISDVIEFRFDADAGTLDRNLNSGGWVAVATGLSLGPYVALIKGDCDVDFGQNGYTPPTSGYKTLNTANLPTVTGQLSRRFVHEVDDEANIEATISGLRSGWSTYVDIYKNLTNIEQWYVRFSHDASNEHRVDATPTYGAVTAFAGTDQTEGLSIRCEAGYGAYAGSVSHTNGVASTVTHNLGTTDVWCLLFDRAGGDVFEHHPSLTSGSLTKLNSTAAQAASTEITNIQTNSIDVGSGVTTGTYDVLVVAKSDFVFLGDYTNNNNADGPAVYTNGSFQWGKLKPYSSGTSNHYIYSRKQSPGNPMNEHLFANTDAVQQTTAHDIDGLATGVKMRTASDPNFSTISTAVVAFVEPLGVRGAAQRRAR